MKANRAAGDRAGGRRRLVIATGDGRAGDRRLQPAGKRVLATAEFLRGYPLRVGDRLGA